MLIVHLLRAKRRGYGAAKIWFVRLWDSYRMVQTPPSPAPAPQPALTENHGRGGLETAAIDRSQFWRLDEDLGAGRFYVW